MNPAQIPGDRQIFRGDRTPHQRIADRGSPPEWRRFTEPSGAETPISLEQKKGSSYYSRPEEINAVNVALYLRRPLLVTGVPGTGKSTLAYAIAYELGLGPVLVWSITSRSTLQQGLYQYDAIGRLHDASIKEKSHGSKGSVKFDPSDIGRFIRLGPLGTALTNSTEERPAVLLIDEIDKSDPDLPNDLLHVFEEGTFEIPELSRLPQGFEKINVGVHAGDATRQITKGRVRCTGFPLVILTSNGERDFPPAFLRRCIRLDIKEPTELELIEIVRRRVGEAAAENPEIRQLIKTFEKQRADPTCELATDQLLNAVYMRLRDSDNFTEIQKIVLRPLNNDRP